MWLTRENNRVCVCGSHPLSQELCQNRVGESANSPATSPLPPTISRNWCRLGSVWLYPTNLQSLYLAERRQPLTSEIWWCIPDLRAGGELSPVSGESPICWCLPASVWYLSQNHHHCHHNHIYIRPLHINVDVIDSVITNNSALCRVNLKPN